MGQIIEGIDNEVMASMGLSLALLLFSLVNVGTKNPQIRPEREDEAGIVRSRVARAEGNGGPGTSREIRADSECPVCYNSPPTYAVETSCGHVFCAECILTWWEIHEHRLRALTCPCCRQKISIFFVSFTPEELVTPIATRHVTSLREYNRLFSGQPRSILQHIRDTPILLRRLFADIINGRNLDLIFRVRNSVMLLVVFAYLVSPIDFIPEAIFGVLGVLDDLLLLIWVIIMLTSFYRAFSANAN